MATRKKHTPEQVVRKLATADRMLNEGKDVADVCRELQVSEQTYYQWRNQFGGMNARRPSAPTASWTTPATSSARTPRKPDGFSGASGSGEAPRPAYCTEPRLIMVAALTGLRLGELAALRDEDLDLDAPALTVRRSGYRETERLKTKTRASVRRVPLTQTAARLLREQLLARPPSPSPWVFPAEDGGQWKKRSLERRFARAARRAGLPEAHFHDLRHTHVSLAAAAGVGPGEIAAMVGHDDGGVLVMRRYRHLFPDALERSAAQLEAYLAPAADRARRRVSAD
jgi:integrase